MRIDAVEPPRHPVYWPAGARLNPGSRLLAEAAAGGSVLAVNMAPDPALAVWRAAGAHLLVQDERASAIACARRLLEGAELRPAVAPETAFAPQSADIALVNLHYLWGRQPARESMVAALAGLRPGGRVLLAGANDRGVRSAADDLAALSGNAPEVLAYGKGHRLVAAVRPAGWAPPAPAEGEPVTADAGGVPVTLRRVPGLFAEGLPDPGTRLLVATVPPASPGQEVLDLGFGGGAVAIAAALRQPLARIWAIDDSLRAVRTTGANAAANGVGERVRAVHGDGLEALPADLRVDILATNPPHHFGAIATTALAEVWLRSAPARLRRGGRLYVVFNRFLPYLKVLEGVFGRDAATLLADADGYRVAGAVRG